MKKMILALLLATTGVAFAQDSTVKGSTHNVAGFLSFPAGGFAFGGAYEYLYDQSAGFGAHFRMFQKDEDRGVDGHLIFGAAMGHHFYKKAWDLSFTPSFNVINIATASKVKDDEMGIGPGLSIALTTQLNDRFAIGFDYSNFWVWFNDDYAGLRLSDFSIKFRAGF